MNATLGDVETWTYRVADLLCFHALPETRPRDELSSTGVGADIVQEIPEGAYYNVHQRALYKMA